MRSIRVYKGCKASKAYTVITRGLGFFVINNNINSIN